MEFFRKIDMAGVLWCLLIAGGYLRTFAGYHFGFMELGTSLSDLSIQVSWWFYGLLVVGALALASIFYRPLLWVVAIVLLVRLVAAIALDLSGIAGHEGAVSMNVIGPTLVAIGGCLLVLKWRNERLDLNKLEKRAEVMD